MHAAGAAVTSGASCLRWGGQQQQQQHRRRGSRGGCWSRRVVRLHDETPRATSGGDSPSTTTTTTTTNIINNNNHHRRGVPRRIALTSAAVGGAASLVDGSGGVGVGVGVGVANALEGVEPPPTSSPADVVRRAASLANGGRGPSTVVFEDAIVRVATNNDSEEEGGGGGGQRVPVGIWYPTRMENLVTATTSSSVSYPHSISVAKIARVLLNTPPTTPRWLDRDIPLQAAQNVVSRAAADGVDDDNAPATVPRGAVVLCHGYLGSRWGVGLILRVLHPSVLSFSPCS